MLDDLIRVLKLIEGDRVDQENLFEAQDKLCDILIKCAKTKPQRDKLLKEFPYFFSLK